MSYTLDEVLARTLVNKNSSSITFYKDYFEICVAYDEAELPSTTVREIYKFNEEPTEDCYSFAIETGRLSKREVNFIKDLKKHNDIQTSLEAVKYNGNLLEFVQNQTPEICLCALRNTNNALIHINIVEYTDLEDCLKKLRNKQKLEKLINEDS